MLLYNSAICDLLRESIQIMKILIHVKVVILVSEKWNEHNLMYIDHKQCEIMQKFNETAQTANFTDFPLIFWGIQDIPCESWRLADSENVVMVFYAVFF